MTEPVRYVIVRGAQVPLDAPCLPFHLTGLTFAHARARVVDPDLIVLHDTGGRGGGPQVHRTLASRKLSVHFFVDRHGVIWQYLDPAMWSAAHVGRGVNSRSIGIECANRVLLGPLAMRPFRRAEAALEHRPIRLEQYRERPRTVIGHTPAQIDSARKLVLGLLEAFPGVPRKLPWVGLTDRISGRMVVPGYVGVSGHLHHTDRHVDPALDVLEALSADLHPAWVGEAEVG